jgi:RNA polymerase sigma-70 factor (ECF subfamily)
MPSDRRRRREFERAILVHLDEVFRYACRVTQDATRAEDMAQEAFLQAWASFDRFEPGTNARAWLYSILHHVLSHARRAEARDRLTLGLDHAPEGVLSYESSLPASLDARVVHEAFAVLDDNTRELLILAEVEGLTYRELANVLDVPLGTVMSRLSRARSRLRALVVERTRVGQHADRASGE